MIFSGPRTTCSNPSSDSASNPQPMRQPEPVQAAALADQSDADGDEGDGHDEPTEPGEPTDDGLDTAAERAGQVEVDGQPQQHTDER